MFNIRASSAIDIGHLQQDSSLGAYIDVNDMLSKHFAVLGTTGVGKSSGVAVILQEILRARPDLRIFLLDPHNEYGRCFGDRALVLNPRNLQAAVLAVQFRGDHRRLLRRPSRRRRRKSISSPRLSRSPRALYCSTAAPTDRPANGSIRKTSGFTVDTPVPYRLDDLDHADRRAHGQARKPLLAHDLSSADDRASRPSRNDPRYAFMFENANVGGDTMAEVLSQLFRLPPNGKPMTVMQLAGFPAEVVDAVVSVLCRMAFDFGLWSDGAAPLLFVCEEAHRYAAGRPQHRLRTDPARALAHRQGRPQIRRLLGLVTQRPAELDPTILSQCSTLFAMRMTNDRDQALLRSAVADTAANLLAFLPSLGTREVFAFGEGVALPTRLKFKQLPSQLLPRARWWAPRVKTSSPGSIRTSLRRCSSAGAARPPIKRPIWTTARMSSGRRSTPRPHRCSRRRQRTRTASGP